jgi:hypothetical protein
MKKLIVSAIAGIALLVTTVIGVINAAPANAGYFTEITHAKDDAGYSAPIYIACKDGRIKLLYKGVWSGSQCGAHVDYMYVSPGMKIRCQNLYPPFGWRTYDTTGWHYIESWTMLKCYVQER